ncbi:MAG: serine protease [Crocosphaera sp.]|uniref:trypsin-like peptidase domain-containing protein n=1 Tax=Crocosphaera sp. TaxID=2729996 RepID=UPI00258611EA|nr:trypsin-like peptidase domain-containing protein [Crocosphaera sp.]MCH2247056.1 serine protease [Crocosphaera sp.]
MDLVYRNLIDSTVCITIPNEQGTGFFVASGMLLTCRHVVKETAIELIQIIWKENLYTPTKVELHPELDLALLWVNIPNHIYVVLDENFNPFDDCFSYGYPPDNVANNAALCKLEAINQDGTSMGIVSEVIRPGLSGAPLLNKNTGKVCGLICKELKVRLRGSILQGFGGVGIPVQKIFEVYPELKNIESHPQWSREEYEGREQDFIQALHQFNYREEVGIFAQFLGSDAPIGAFLICGEEETGQSWLLNRLWRDEVRASNSGVKYQFKVNKKWTIETIWEKVGGVLGVAPEPNVIAEKMYEYWQNSEPVALVLYPVEKLKRSVLQQLIEELWIPLANYAENVESEVPLLLFLVDTGNGNNSAIEAVSAQPNYNSDCPNIPVVLNLKEQFFDKDINSWTNIYRETIKSLFRQNYFTNNLDRVDDLENRKSISPIQHFKREIKSYNAREDSTPEDVLQRICELCEHDLEESFTSKFAFKLSL